MGLTFLSDEWLAEATKLRDELGVEGGPDVQINVVVTGGPQGDREVHFSGGNFGTGLLDGAPTKLTVPFDVAKKVFVDGDQSAAMQAFMSGQVKVEGDMTKIMAMQGGAPSPAQQELQTKLKEMTEG